MAAAPGPANQRLNLVQAYCQDKFHLYRNGITGFSDSLRTIYDGHIAGIAAHTARWNNILARRNTIPRAGYFRFILWHRARLGAIAAANRIPYRGWEQPPIPRPDDETQEPIKEQLNNFRELLRSTLRFVKCVGWGRDGVLTLWRYRPSRGREHLVVLKQSAIGGRPPGRPGARPRLSVTMLMREKEIMTVSIKSNTKFPYLSMLTHQYLSDAMSSTSHCTALLDGRPPSRCSHDPW